MLGLVQEFDCVHICCAKVSMRNIETENKEMNGFVVGGTQSPFFVHMSNNKLIWFPFWKTLQ